MIPEWHNDFRTPSVFSQVAKLRILLRKPPLCPAELRDRKENLAFGDQLHSASRAGWCGLRQGKATNEGRIYSRAVFAISLPRIEAFASHSREYRRPFCSLLHVSTHHRRSNMMTFLSALEEEGFLTYEVSDDVLETAGENNIAGNYTLASCTGLSVCPG